MTSTPDIDKLRYDLEELRVIAQAEPTGRRKELFERLYKVCEKELADMIIAEITAPATQTPPPPRAGYARKRFLVLTDTERCECVSLYKSTTGEPCGVKGAIAFAKSKYDDLDWDNLEQTIVEAWVKVPPAPPAPEVVEGEEVP